MLGQSSIEGTATRYRLDWPAIEILCTLLTGPRTYPASHTMGTMSFLGVKRLECGTDLHQVPRLKKEKSYTYGYPPCCTACYDISMIFPYYVSQWKHKNKESLPSLCKFSHKILGDPLRILRRDYDWSQNISRVMLSNYYS